MGQLLGANKREEAIEKNRQLLFFSVSVTAVIGLVMTLFAGVFPDIYNTEEEVKSLAAAFIIISSIILPANAYCHSGYFTIRSGGRTKIILMMDIGFTYFFVIPLAFILSRFTSIPPISLYAIVQGAELVKCVIVYLILRSGSWAKNIVDNI